MEIPDSFDPLVWNELPLDIQQELIQLQTRQIHKNTTNLGCGTKKLQQLSIKFTKDKVVECWRDEMFPASPSSIDGRRSFNNEQITTKKKSSEPSQVKCKCGKVMISRQVSKVGINQGRYFYSCVLKQCNTFIWAEGVPHRSSVLNLEWKSFRSSDGWKMMSTMGTYAADDIIQGNIGDCWFLSAVVVLCERPDLLEKVLGPNPTLSTTGQTFSFFVNGEWREIRVDNFLPCLPENDPSNSKKRKISSTNGPLLAFSRAKRSQLWVSFLEKAYAKLYNCYDALHGGHIPEALFDLTGCPCESIHINSSHFNSEQTWTNLMTYRSLGFPMGCSTDFSGEGIVGNHAYSLLDVRELHDIQLGEQLSIKDYFAQQDLFSWSTSPSSPSSSSPSSPSTPESREVECIREVQSTGQLRLLRIRNPWGKREWNGNFSSHSSLWTTKLKKLLSETSSNSNSSCSVDNPDGSFWITYTDFLRRFVTIDICKAYHQDLNWQIKCVEDCLTNTNSTFLLTVNSSSKATLQSSLIYFSILQESKRGSFASHDPQRKFSSYRDISAIIRRYTTSSSPPFGEFDGEVVGTIFSAPMRTTCPLELQLLPGRYIIQIFTFSSPNHHYPSSSSTINASHRHPPPHNHKYWLHFYSSQSLEIQKLPHFQLNYHSNPSLNHLNCSISNLYNYLDEISSSFYHSSPESRILTHLCSTIIPSSSVATTTMTTMMTTGIQLDVYVLRGNGMNLLFCRSLSSSSPPPLHSHLPLPFPVAPPNTHSFNCHVEQCIDLTEIEDQQQTQQREDDKNEKEFIIEITTIQKSNITMISPYLVPSLPTSTTTLTPQESFTNSDHSIQDLTQMLKTFQFHGIKNNQLKLLAIIFDTRGSDSFEFVGEIYLHTTVVRVMTLSKTKIIESSVGGGHVVGVGVEDGNRDGYNNPSPSYFIVHNCQT